MNISQRIAIALGGGAIAFSGTAAVPEVTGVTMTQNSWRQVKVEYTLANAPAVVTLDIETNVTGTAEWISIGGENIQKVTGDVWKRIDGNGRHEIFWRPDLSWPGHKIDTPSVRAKVTAWSTDNTPDYMVVDISSNATGATQREYYPNAGTLPGGVISNPAYRTTKLLFRKIAAKDVEWTMGSPIGSGWTPLAPVREATHSVTLTNNYYIGVFEITQAQFALVQTNFPAPSYFTTDGAMRPVESVAYNEIRLTESAAGHNDVKADDAIMSYSWPAEPYEKSFLGLLHDKTGVWFDLPSEAQWEYAARAGNNSWYWGNGTCYTHTDPGYIGIGDQQANGNWNQTYFMCTNECRNLNVYGRYRYNGGYVDKTTKPSYTCPVENGTAIAGSYEPNDWGLYDMAGNVYEWCLDWYVNKSLGSISGYDGAPNIDPSDPMKALDGTKYHGVSGIDLRVRKGGSWTGQAGENRPAYRSGGEPHRKWIDNTGFRLVCNSLLK